MRTTLTLDDDIADQAQLLSAQLNLSFKKVVNEALRRGLKQLRVSESSRPYQTRPHRMGLRPGYNLDNIQELISQVEGEAAK